MPNPFARAGGLPPRPPTQEEIELAEKRKKAAEDRSAQRIAEMALRGTKKSLRVQQPAPPPKPAVPPAKPAVAAAASAPAPKPPPPPAHAPVSPPASDDDRLPPLESAEEVFESREEGTGETDIEEEIDY